MDYQFSIVEFPETLIAGITIDTNMEKVSQDCPTLWHEFGHRLCSDLSDYANSNKAGISFGVCQLNANNPDCFTYWTAIPVLESTSLPNDLKTITIPAGSYVTCKVANLEKLQEAYTALYTQWLQSQNTYQLATPGLCFELYPANWQPNTPFEIYAAVVKQ